MTTPTRNRLQEGGAVGTLRQTAVSHIGFTVPDVAATADFYGRTVGLTVQEELVGGGLRLGWGLGHHVLDLTEGPKGLSHYGFEVRDVDGLDCIAKRLADAGHHVAELDPAVLDHAVGVPSGISVTDPDGTTVHFHGPVARQGENAADPGRRPIKFQHTTLGTDNVAQMVSFFVDTVGFRISDQLEDGKFAWLRSDRDHHTLAVVENGNPGDLDHYSYDLAEWEDFKSWCDRLTEIGVDVVWGPGRHGPGNNLFVFFDDPAGNHIELSAEMEKFHDDRATYVTRQWRPVPASVNLWGGQLASWRKTSESEI
ncbi:glyoxalase [Rhodococcus sp. 05-340-1]|uniref:VOC family protein n=1 Tax=unclassified Rhodococcus (in: high G+C Gram-positive bacteria) TaxID=192944 RepID=UPI000B9C4996|nr:MULTISPECIES: VOC family protein [unclassified Rhodococcus (in: high G+C Gram-positive bacteria)]OZD70698.1 glyoxalase [Rhodococcus sp. 05-340-1]OZD72257.1 glyoxalase [Rhodococcus sp. 05-340-2]